MNKRKKGNAQKKQPAQSKADQNKLGLIDKEETHIENEETKEETKNVSESGSEMEFEGQEESTFASVAQTPSGKHCCEPSEWIEVTGKNGRTSSHDKEEETKDETPANGNEKKKRKRNNKKKIAKKKELQKEFRERNVSPVYDQVMECNFHAELQITNLNENHRSVRRKENDLEDESSSQNSDNGGEVSSNEEIEDYQLEGYHPMHVE